MSSLLLVAFFITFLDTLKGNNITSCSSFSTCTCQSGEACIIDCSGNSICDQATINAGSATSVTIDCIGFRACYHTTFNIGNVPLAGGITCSGTEQACRSTIFNAGNHGSQFDITCSGGGNSCSSAEINAGNASSVTMYCNSNNGCDFADINCGVGGGACNIHCNAFGACAFVDLICNTASDCTLRCDYGHDYSCLDLVGFDCGTSVCCSMYCDESLDVCRNANNIYPDVTDAISFKCIGVGCTANFINTQPKCSAEDETCPKCTCINDCVHDLGPDGAYQIIRMVSDTEECCHICKKTKDCSSWMYLTSTSCGIEDECYLSGDCFLYQQKFQECDTINIQHGKYISGSVFDKKCVDNDDCCEGDICDINKGKCKKNSESLSSSSSSSSSSSDKFIAIGDIINMDNERNKVYNYKSEQEDKIIELSLSSSTYTIIFIICFVVLICTIIWRIFAFVIFK